MDGASGSEVDGTADGEVDGTAGGEVDEATDGTAADEIIATAAYETPAEWKHEFVDLDGETAELTRMRVNPEWQGRGVGRKLYRDLERRASADGWQRFLLDTGTENDAARGFYESLGFDRLRELTVEFDGVTLELVLYETSIGSSS